jgi:hypothetical protein
VVLGGGAAQAGPVLDAVVLLWDTRHVGARFATVPSVDAFALSAQRDAALRFFHLSFVGQLFAMECGESYQVLEAEVGERYVSSGPYGHVARRISARRAPAQRPGSRRLRRPHRRLVHHPGREGVRRGGIPPIFCRERLNAFEQNRHERIPGDGLGGSVRPATHCTSAEGAISHKKNQRLWC